MAQTFSQSLTGVGERTRYTAKSLIVGDTDIAGNAVGNGNVNSIGAQQGVMQRNGYILCKGPDGALSYHVIDAERSIPGQYIVLRKV